MPFASPRFSMPQRQTAWGAGHEWKVTRSGILCSNRYRENTITCLLLISASVLALSCRGCRALRSENCQLSDGCVPFPLILLRLLYAVRFHSPRLKPGIRVFRSDAACTYSTSEILCACKPGCVSLRGHGAEKGIGFQKCRSWSSAGTDGRGYANRHKAKQISPSAWLTAMA